MKTDQQGDTCTFTYNLAGQLLSRAYRTAANSPSGTVADSDTFTYDRAGRMLTALSGRYANTVTLAYDHAGRLASEGLTIAGQTYSVGRTYDVRGLEATLSYPGGAVVQRSYTPQRQPASTSSIFRARSQPGRVVNKIHRPIAVHRRTCFDVRLQHRGRDCLASSTGEQLGELRDGYRVRAADSRHGSG